MKSQTTETLDHLFRRESGKIVAYLTRSFGSDHLDLAECVVQEALLKAVQIWPLEGTPENPGGWILRVAKNLAIDHIRREKFLIKNPESILEEMEADSSDKHFENEITDDQLRLLFICCHPSLTSEAQLALTLKSLCGFSVKEIARAFLAKEETIAQRIVRAKQKISDEKIPYEVPAPSELPARLDSVLQVLYLLFNEGYLATEGSSLIRKDLCDEAFYRTQVLANHPVCATPKVFALLALMHLQASRFNSRTDNKGELLLLEEQDRSLWDQQHIRAGLYALELSAEGDELSDYHLQAGIASCHALAPTFADTDWERILSYYDMMALDNNSPIVLLNRSVAVAMLNGPEAGLSEIERIKNLSGLKNYYLLPATIAELHRRLGNWNIALEHYQKALLLVGTEPEKNLIQKRISSCKENL